MVKPAVRRPVTAVREATVRAESRSERAEQDPLSGHLHRRASLDQVLVLLPGGRQSLLPGLEMLQAVATQSRSPASQHPPPAALARGRWRCSQSGPCLRLISSPPIHLLSPPRAEPASSSLRARPSSARRLCPFPWRGTALALRCRVLSARTEQACSLRSSR